MRFDIILDHTAGFADAIVGHGSGQRESGMGRKAWIVAETRRGLAAAGLAGDGPRPWHTCVSPGTGPAGRAGIVTDQAAARHC
jgi:hypothetical protein